MKNQDTTFHQCIAAQFSSLRIPKSQNNNSVKNIQVSKLVKVPLLPPPPVLPRFSKSKLEKSKYYQKKGMNSAQNTNKGEKKSYAQASFAKINKVLKTKENFSNLSAKRIEDIHKTVNGPRKEKSCINITTKSPSKRQFIVPMDNNNISNFMSSSGEHIFNINRALKDIKSNILAYFVHNDHQGLIITTNKVASPSDLSVIENYIKNVNAIESEDIMASHLPQSKFYLKIIGILYILENTNVLINSSIVKSIIKSTHIFNNALLVSKLQVIKASLKLDMVIIWIDIWNIQSGTKAKSLTNRTAGNGNIQCLHTNFKALDA